MEISKEDLDELISALGQESFGMPYMARISVYGREGIAEADRQAEEDNRNALRRALESTKAWSRYRIY
jgi:hypothetical protein